MRWFAVDCSTRLAALIVGSIIETQANLSNALDMLSHVLQFIELTRNSQALKWLILQFVLFDTLSHENSLRPAFIL